MTTEIRTRTGETITQPFEPYPDLVLPDTRLFIGGARYEATSGERIDVEDPATGSVFGSIPGGAAQDVDKAVKAARSAFESPAWARMAPIERGRLLEEIARKIEAHALELAVLESYDNGKAVAHALSIDVPAAVKIFRYMSGWCSKIHGKTNPVSPADGKSYFSYTQREPIGVVGAIVPWNYPLSMAAWKVATALAAGCTMILKPSELTSMTALRLCELAHEAGLPDGVFNVLTGFGYSVGQAMVEHRGIDKIAFTGSTAVGKSIVRTVADDLKRVTLELGGKSPSIVFDDCDLDRIGMGGALAIFFNSGQICFAASRLYVQRSVFDRVLQAVADAAASFKIGHGRDPGTMIGPLVSRKQQERVLEYVDVGRGDGADVIKSGGLPDGNGYFVEPTIIVDPASDSRVVQEEIFGPVLVAKPFDDIDEVVGWANDTRYGLGANVWTRDLSRAHQTAARLQAGTVWINTHGLTDPSAPFGGFKESGWGREVGEEGLSAYLESKTITAFLGD
ncbi:MAG: aldehyde dehydrogenase family protein [Novosphingobium sp.]